MADDEKFFNIYLLQVLVCVCPFSISNLYIPNPHSNNIEFRCEMNYRQLSGKLVGRKKKEGQHSKGVSVKHL